MVVDIPEITFNHLLEFYRFPTQLLSDHNKDNQLGILFSDGVILPLTRIILYHYAAHTNKHWRVSFVFAVIQGTLEWIYLSLEYLTYLKWNIWISIDLYFLMSRFGIVYTSRFLFYQPPIPYFVRIGAATYAITAWIGAMAGGAFLSLYQWRSLIFVNESADDRFSDLGISWIFAMLSAVIIPRISLKFRPLVFVTFALIAIVFSYFAHYGGWLIYHHWSTLLTALRWIVPFAALVWFDRWESTYHPANRAIDFRDS